MATLRQTVVLVLLLGGCARPTMPLVAPPAAGQGFQLVTPAVEVPEFEEQLWCSFFPALTEDMLVAQIDGFQSAGGHHAALFVADIPPKDLSKPVRCDGEDTAPEMTGWRFLGGGDAQTSGDPLPDSVALMIPKGKAIMVQSHYIAPQGGVFARDIVNVTKWTKAEAPILADFWAVGQIAALAVPPCESQVSADCEITEDVKVLYVLGHTHDKGNLFKLEVIRKGETEPVEGGPLYYETNGPRMRVDPPRIRFGLDAPLEFKRGDKVRYTCGWSNDSSATIGWPIEMCQGLMLYFPSYGFQVCDAGRY